MAILEFRKPPYRDPDVIMITSNPEIATYMLGVAKDDFRNLRPFIDGIEIDGKVMRRFPRIEKYHRP